jgi:hypothetical protein
MWVVDGWFQRLLLNMGTVAKLDDTEGNIHPGRKVQLEEG